jgi:hypothetical protein
LLENGPEGASLSSGTNRLTQTRKRSIAMASEPIRDPEKDHLLTPYNAAFIIIDYHPAQVNSIAPMDRQLLIHNFVGTSKVALA